MLWLGPREPLGTDGHFYRSLAGFTLVFRQETLDLIQLDGAEVEPQLPQEVNSAGVLYPGQRMDLILRSPPGSDAGRASSMTVRLERE